MSNPFEGTPAWAKYYSQQMDWPVTKSVDDAVHGLPVRCDICGATETLDPAWPIQGFPLRWIEITRPMSLDADYCFGCGVVLCHACDRDIDGSHKQSDHGNVQIAV